MQKSSVSTKARSGCSVMGQLPIAVDEKIDMYAKDVGKFLDTKM